MLRLLLRGTSVQSKILLRNQSFTSSSSVQSKILFRNRSFTSSSSCSSTTDVDAQTTNHLLHLLQKNEIKKGWSALKYFKTLVHNKQATLTHYNIALSNLCQDAKSQRNLMKRMNQQKIRPDTESFHALIQQLLMEGNTKEAHKVAQKEMPQADIQPTPEIYEQIQDAEKRTPSRTSKTRKENREDPFFMKKNQTQPQNTASNVEPVDRTTKQHTNAMLNMQDSNEQRNYILNMKKQNVIPDVKHFTILIKSLLYDGKKEEAQNVIDVDMVESNVQPSAMTHDTMHKADALHAQKHTGILNRLKGSDQKRNYILYEMEKLNVEPNIYHYNILIQTLIWEKKYEEIKEVMNVILMATHLEPNQKTNEMIQSVSKVQEQEPQVTNDENSNFNTNEISFEDFFESRMNVEDIVDISDTKENVNVTLEDKNQELGGVEGNSDMYSDFFKNR